MVEPIYAMHIKVGKLYIFEYDHWCQLDNENEGALRKIIADDPFVVLEAIFFPDDQTRIISQLKVLSSKGEICKLIAYSKTIKEAPS